MTPGCTSLSNWESGAAWPSTERLHTLCFHYGVTQDEFLALTSPLGSEAGEYLDAPLDLEQTRAMLDSYTLWQIPPISGMLLAQRLSFLAPTSAEARSLLCRTYVHLGNQGLDSQSRVRTQHFLGLAQQLDEVSERENSILIAVALNHFVRAPLMYNAPPCVLTSLYRPEELAARKKKEAIVGKQAYALLEGVMNSIVACQAIS